LRLDSWRDHSVPAVTARIDAGWSRNGTMLSLSAGSALATPALSDLFFREGVGVRINPDLRPERTLWEIAAALRRTWAVGRMGVTASARLFYGRVVDMVLWAPGYQFIWSPMNFNVRRRGGELNLGVSPAGTLHLEAGAGYNAVTYDVPDGAQVRYRPQVTSQVALSWAPRRWQADVRWHFIGSRFPNSAGTNPLPPINLVDLGLERSLGSALVLRGGVHDLLDERAEFIAGYPVPGRTFTLTLDLTIQ
jgi:vitamin B12 transporter